MKIKVRTSNGIEEREVEPDHTGCAMIEIDGIPYLYAITGGAPAPDNEYAHVHGFVEGGSQKALLVNIGTEKFWIPRSQLHKDSITEFGTEGEIIFKRWIAKKHGIDGSVVTGDEPAQPSQPSEPRLTFREWIQELVEDDDQKMLAKLSELHPRIEQVLASLTKKSDDEVPF